MTTIEITAPDVAQIEAEIAELEARAVDLDQRHTATQIELEQAQAGVVAGQPKATQSAAQARAALDALAGALRDVREQIAAGHQRRARMAAEQERAAKLDSLAALARVAHEKRAQFEQVAVATAAAMSSGLAEMNQLLDTLAGLRAQFVQEVQTQGIAPDLFRQNFGAGESQKMEQLERQLESLSTELYSRGTDLHGVLANYEHPRTTRPLVYCSVSIPYTLPAVNMGAELHQVFNAVRGELQRERHQRTARY
jgi:chromosome segregation ATPase